MNTTTFRVAKMDCAAEEQLVRMALDEIDGVVIRRIDRDERTVTASHPGDAATLRQRLDALHLDTTQLATGEETVPADATTSEKRSLTIALVINTGLFVGEFVAGIIGRSMGLLADSLDMLADATVYALSLLAVGATATRKRRLARGSGYLQLGLAVAGLLETLRRLVTSGAPPDVATMVAVSAIALIGNIVTLLVLKSAQSDEVHFQASWIFTANDIKVNALVIMAAIVVAVTNNATADLLAGAAIFLIVANGARRILAIAR